MSQTLPQITEALLDAARKAGADASDAIAIADSSTHIDVRGGKLETAERSEGTEIGLRVLLGKRSAITSASDTRPETLAIMAERAVAMAREAPEDPHAGLADPSQITARTDAAGLELYDPAPEPSPAELQADAARAEAAALGHKGISQVQSASAGYGQTEVYLAASNGFAGGYRRSGRSTSVVAITGEGTGMERDYDGDSRVFQADLRSPEEIGTTAALRTLERMNPRRPRTGAFPVLFDERISAGLIGHLLGAANGAAIARGSSWLIGKLGQQVLPRGLSIIEDPHRPRISGSRPFDAEGLATAPRQIVQDGILQGWTLDLASARKLGMQSTGNAARGAGSPPSPATWNIALTQDDPTQGSKTRAELMAEMGTGLWVTSMIGATINPNTGDYSRGAAGIWVENGEPAYAVNECTIAGNLLEMLRRITPANDARDYLSRVVPSLLVEGMTLAGE